MEDQVSASSPKSGRSREGTQLWPTDTGDWLLTAVIVENGVRLRLNIIDTPGYGDMINNEGCWDPIVKYVS